MALGLDLSGSVAKVARARVHYECYKREFHRICEESEPHTDIVVSEISPEGRALVVVITRHSHSEQLGLIAGDAFQNLRSALDYIISALATRSGVDISRHHQFPIRTREDEYRKWVGTEGSALDAGCLRGLTYGLKEIWDAQPFNEKGDAVQHPLFTVNRFSNADKHRLISEAFYPVYSVSGHVWYNQGSLIEEDVFETARPLSDDTYAIGRVRFGPPFPTECGFNGEVTVKPLLRTPAFGKDSEYTIYGAYVDDLCEFVSKTLEVFQAL